MRYAIPLIIFVVTFLFADHMKDEAIKEIHREYRYLSDSLESCLKEVSYPIQHPLIHYKACEAIVNHDYRNEKEWEDYIRSEK